MEWLSQIFGTIAIISSLIIYSRNKRQHILLFKSVQDASWLTHYMLLACYPAAATSVVNIVRSLVFYNSDKKWAKSRLWIVVFLSLYACSVALTWQNVYSLLPAVSSSISTIAFRMKEPRRIKLLAISASLCTLLYNILQSHSVTVYIGITITITTAAVSLISGRRSHEKER